MKNSIFFLFFIYLSYTSLAQAEDPVKVLALHDHEKVDKYLESKGWKHLDVDTNEVEMVCYLYRRKSLGHGYAYIAVYPQKFMHYQVFFSEKKHYSPVLSYSDFLEIPEGDARYGQSHENDLYHIKTVSFDDPHETRNKNIFYGKTLKKASSNNTER